ncbi:glutamate receptor ionotropic, NMDA 1-like [Halyomorpha halys]|uniref:glutamate receptor ionotropic, NMDA 1-like n=1 Tax=Halyomorpha halys TaxID=286706 RepID=UPI0034D24C17
MLNVFRSVKEDLLDAVESIAVKHFYGNYLCFFYPTRQPPPDLVFSNLLQRMHKHWTPIMPIFIPNAGALNSKGFTINFIKCSYLIPIHNKNYTSQLTEIAYSAWNNIYRSGDSPYTRFIVVVDGEVSMNEGYEALKMMFRFGDINAVIVGRERNVVSVFTLFPFGQDGKSCPGDNMQLSRIAQWNEKFTEVDFFPDKVPRILQGCDFPVSTVRYPPATFPLGEGKYDGFDIRLLGIVSENINASLIFTYYDRIDGWLWVDDKRNVKGSINDVREGISWATVSGIANNQWHHSVCIIQTPYVYAKLMWYFPNPLPIEKWKFVYLAFSKELWIAGVATAVLTPFFFYLFAKVSRIEYYFIEFEKSCFTLWSIAFGNSTGFMPKTVHFRVIFSLWLFCTIHLTLAYTASLTGLITGGKMEAKVTNINDIIERNLTMATFMYMVRQLSDMDEPKIKKAVSKYVLVNNYDETFATMIKYRNLSILDNNVYIDHLIVKKKLSIYRTPVTLVRVPSGIMMRRNHFLLERIDRIVQRLISAGITDKMIKDFTVPLWKTQDKKDWKPVDITAVAGPFILFACGIFLSCIAFFLEIIYFHRKKFIKLLK